VDGEVLVTSSKEIKRGDFVNVKITGSEDYDLLERWFKSL
jgi:ribosomal protein S12 methylthiotransferase